MTDQELRQLVRDAIARHVGGATPVVPHDQGAFAPVVFARDHVSHGQFPYLSPGPDGSCVIEPHATCSHCGFCKSYGH